MNDDQFNREMNLHSMIGRLEGKVENLQIKLADAEKVADVRQTAVLAMIKEIEMRFEQARSERALERRLQSLEDYIAPLREYGKTHSAKVS